MGVQDAAPSNAGQYAYQAALERQAAQFNTYGHMPSNVLSSVPYVPQQTAAEVPGMTPATMVERPARKRKAPAADIAVVDLTGESPPIEIPKRKRKTAKPPGEASAQKSKAIKEGQANNGNAEKPKKKARDDGEKRLRRWRAAPPSAYREVRDRALTQRMFALDRQRNNDAECPSETISLAGTTGNVYTITIDKVPSCDCPHARKGNQCKHIVYVLSRVLRAPAELEYQLALTSSELKKIFANAPPLPSETADNDEKDGNRKPIEGECPICCNDFEPKSSETIIYCKAACGNNIHKDCFGQWAATKTGQDITCPFCRSPWQGDEEQLKQVAKSGSKNAEGYVNVASQLGLSGRRDYSTYNSYWVRGQARRGEIAWDEDGVMEHEY